MKEINLSNGGAALIDDADFELVNRWKWRRSENGYAVRTSWKGKILMHRLVIGVIPKGLEVDHINRIKLDNRRCNLRAVTHSENQRNTPKQSNNTSGFKGVSWDKSRGKWRAATKHNGKHILIGRFNTPQEASRAYESVVPQVAQKVGEMILKHERGQNKPLKCSP
jgi:hypothetical protein